MNNKFSIKEVVEIAVKIEEYSQAFYHGCVSTSNSDEIKKAFEFIAFEEEIHFNKFKDMLKRIGGPEKENNYYGNEAFYLKSISQEVVFGISENVEKLVRKCENINQALDIAIQLEKDSMKFYQLMTENVQGDDRKIIDKIIAEENIHINIIEKIKNHPN